MLFYSCFPDKLVSLQEEKLAAIRDKKVSYIVSLYCMVTNYCLLDNEVNDQLLCIPTCDFVGTSKRRQHGYGTISNWLHYT